MCLIYAYYLSLEHNYVKLYRVVLSLRMGNVQKDLSILCCCTAIVDLQSPSCKVNTGKKEHFRRYSQTISTSMRGDGKDELNLSVLEPSFVKGRCTALLTLSINCTLTEINIQTMDARRVWMGWNNEAETILILYPPSLGT